MLQKYVIILNYQSNLTSFQSKNNIYVRFFVVNLLLCMKYYENGIIFLNFRGFNYRF